MDIKKLINSYVSMAEDIGENEGTFAKMNRLLLMHGENFNKEQLTGNEQDEMLAIIWESCGMSITPKSCFATSQRMFLSARARHNITAGRLNYCEGYGKSIIPVPHAWLEYNGKVVDAVWGSLSWVQSQDRVSAGKDTEYFGVRLPFWVVAELVGSNALHEAFGQPLLPLVADMEREKIERIFDD